MTLDERIQEASGETLEQFASRVREVFGTDQGAKVLRVLCAAIPPNGSAFDGPFDFNQSLVAEGNRQLVSFLWRASLPKP